MSHSEINCRQTPWTPCGRDGAEEWSSSTETHRNNATLSDRGVDNQTLTQADIEVAVDPLFPLPDTVSQVALW